ncbi:hypothetical protein C9374_010303 [Naegleria lovaniensis]|uniref:Uncharacterized protein n=1 Tax=Naegleria lovaniensis TaxID=51637 RepID=A0AA88KG06_NAELO|nr:uncharacterized protein C9374_010303 [Naegleria lovaniensis]KAG2374929.1 hypothetical protein C9374_010303 [Naegleria lovaniensis]
MSATLARKPLQDISNKVHHHRQNMVVQSVEDRKRNAQHSAKKTANEDDEPVAFNTPGSLGSLASELEELADLNEFYEDVSFELNDKMSKSLEKEMEKNAKLELQSERDRKQIAELVSENKALNSAIEQLKQKAVSKSESELRNQLKTLNDKIGKLEKRLEVETQQKEKLNALLIKKESEKAKSASAVEDTTAKLTKKFQEQIALKDEKIERLTKDMEKERKTKQEFEVKISELQKHAEDVKLKYMSTCEELETSNKLVEILDAKLKISNDRCKDLEEQRKQGELKREEESSELLALREEMSNLCESVLKEKLDSEKKSQEISKLTSLQEKLVSENGKLSQDLRTLESENSELKNLVEKLEHQIDEMGNEIDNSSKEFQEIKDSFAKRLEELEQQVSEKEAEVNEMRQKEERTMGQLKELDIFVERTKKKIEKEREKTREAEERANSEAGKAIQMINRNNSLLKKLDSLTKSNYEMADEIKDKEDLLVRFKNYTEEVEASLSKKERELEETVQRFNATHEELQKEKAKTERTWKELEESVKLLNQLQNEKESLEKKSSHAREVLEMKLTNKLSMLEKKCDYLRKLNEMNAQPESDQVNELKQLIEKLSKENDKLSERATDLEISMSTKECELLKHLEKIRQLEDLLNNQANMQSASLKPNDLKKRLISVEKSLDEILIELSIEGITISQLSPREKAVIILEKFNDLKKECSALLSVRDQQQAEVQRLKESKEKTEKQMMMLKDSLTSEVLERNEECVKDLQESCENLYKKINMVLEEKEFSNSTESHVDSKLLDELVELVISIQVNMKKVKVHFNQVDTLQRVIETQDVFNKDFVLLCGELENRVRSLVEERDTLITAQIQQKDKAISSTVKKKLEKLIYKHVVVQTEPSSVEEQEIQTCQEMDEAERENHSNFNNNSTLYQEHESLKQKYQKLLGTCHKYKKLMLKFTQLHAKEKNRENLNPENHRLEPMNLSNCSHHTEVDSMTPTHSENHHLLQDQIPLIHASLHKPQISLKSSSPSLTSSHLDHSMTETGRSSPAHSVNSVRSVSTTLSMASSERSSSLSTISAKIKKNVAAVKSNSYLSSHMMMNKNKVK